MKTSYKNPVSPKIVTFSTQPAASEAAALHAALFAAVGDDAAWHGVVKLICEHFQAQMGMLVVAGQGQRDQSFYAAHNHAESVARAYSDHWWQHDIWLHTGLKNGFFVAGNIGRGSDFVAPTLLRSTAFYKDFLLTMPAEHLLCMILSDGSEPDFAPPMHLSLFRAPDQPDFSADDTLEMYGLFPYIRRAFELHWKLRSMGEQLDVFYRSLDSMDFGVSFLDAGGKLRFANHAAKNIASSAGSIRASELFGVKNSAPLVPNHVAISPSDDSDWAQLPPLLLAAATGQGGACLLDQRGKMAMALPVSNPQRNAAGEARAAVMLLLIDPEKHRADAALEFVNRAFALSPAESRLLPLLLKGASPTEIAQQLGLKLPTVRSQLSAIFAKTGTSRQQELIRLLGSMPPVLADQA